MYVNFYTRSRSDRTKIFFSAGSKIFLNFVIPVLVVSCVAFFRKPTLCIVRCLCKVVSFKYIQVAWNSFRLEQQTDPLSFDPSFAFTLDRRSARRALNPFRRVLHSRFVSRVNARGVGSLIFIQFTNIIIFDRGWQELE